MPCALIRLGWTRIDRTDTTFVPSVPIARIGHLQPSDYIPISVINRPVHRLRKHKKRVNKKMNTNSKECGRHDDPREEAKKGSQKVRYVTNHPYNHGIKRTQNVIDK